MHFYDNEAYVSKVGVKMSRIRAGASSRESRLEADPLRGSWPFYAYVMIVKLWLFVCSDACAKNPGQQDTKKNRGLPTIVGTRKYFGSVNPFCNKVNSKKCGRV